MGYIRTRHSRIMGSGISDLGFLRSADFGLQGSDDLNILGFRGLGIRGSWKST